MILSQPSLQEAVNKGEISFSPELEKIQWGEASIDLRLGFRFVAWKKNLSSSLKVSVADGLDKIQQLDLWDTQDLAASNSFGKPESLPIGPGEFVLAMTYESVKIPRDMIARIEGRSTYARVGLSMHQTAPWIQPGWDGPITLEIVNNGPLTVELTPVKDRPCQLTFFRLSTPLPENRVYGTREMDIYQGQKHPIITKTNIPLT